MKTRARPTVRETRCRSNHLRYSPWAHHCFAKTAAVSRLWAIRRFSSSAISPGMIGDPSGRSVTRPQLTHRQCMANAASLPRAGFQDSRSRRGRKPCAMATGFGAMSFEDVIRLNSRVTLQQMLQREDFKTRIDNQQSISRPRNSISNHAGVGFSHGEGRCRARRNGPAFQHL